MTASRRPIIGVYIYIYVYNYGLSLVGRFHHLYTFHYDCICDYSLLELFSSFTYILIIYM